MPRRYSLSARTIKLPRIHNLPIMERARLFSLSVQESLVRNLRDIKAVFDGSGIRFWLDYGTLLGAVREGRTIGWDDDIDLGTLSDSWNRIIRTIPQLQDRGFCGGSTEFRIHGELFFRRIWLRRHGVGIDIFVYEVVGENAIGLFLTRKKNRYLMSTKHRLSTIFRWTYLMLSGEIYHTPHPSIHEYRLNSILKVFGSIQTLVSYHSRMKFVNLIWRIGRAAGIRVIQVAIPKHFFKELDTTRIWGMVFSSPSKTEEYLSYHYGNWRIPDRAFDSNKDDRAIVGYF
jgi:phosphorylcholine metabolism protein LicD